MRRISRGESVVHFETIRRRKDGEMLPISVSISPVRDASGRVIGASKIARDITERKLAEQRPQLLVGEVKHRIKNLLATVQAIARQTLKGAPAEDRDAFVARLMALANAQDLLTLERWNRAPVNEVVEPCATDCDGGEIDPPAPAVADTMCVSGANDTATVQAAPMAPVVYVPPLRLPPQPATLPTW